MSTEAPAKPALTDLADCMPQHMPQVLMASGESFAAAEPKRMAPQDGASLDVDLNGTSTSAESTTMPEPPYAPDSTSALSMLYLASQLDC